MLVLTGELTMASHFSVNPDARSSAGSDGERDLRILREWRNEIMKKE